MKVGFAKADVFCKDRKCIHRVDGNEEYEKCTNKGAVRNIPDGCNAAYCDKCAMACYKKSV